VPSFRIGRRTVVIGGVVVIVVAGGTTAWAMTSGSGASYRMATAAMGSVKQSLTATGTLSPVHDDAGTFQTSGTVKKVKVKVGQKVAPGQVLAVLDESALKETLRQAKSSLATDQTRLSDAENGQLDAASGGSGNSNASNSNANEAAVFQSAKKTVATPSASPTANPTGAPSGGGSGSGGTGGAGSTSGSSSKKIAADQAAIRKAQQDVDDALGVAQTALDTEKSACASTTTPPTTSPSPTSTSTPAPTSGLSCSDAASALLSDQTIVNKDETTLDQTELALTKDLQAAAASASKSSSSSQSTKSSSSSRSSGSSSGLSGNSSSSTVTAADLASDQAAIDSAKAQVATAKDDLEQATLRSSISGTVTAVTIAKGDSVTSSATSPAVEVVGAGQEQVAIALSASQIRQVKVGMSAAVVPDGMSIPSSGKVVAIQAGGTESSSGTVSYPVTITIPQRSGLVNGAAAAVTIVAAQVDNVLTVPTSAVHRSGTTAYVETLAAGKLKRRTVTIGALGASLTQINSGLTAGTRVVLANMKASLPSSSSNLTSNRTGNAGTFRRFDGGGAGGTGGPGGSFSGTLPGGGSFSINRSGG
jgi:HlyD family secretion protein